MLTFKRSGRSIVLANPFRNLGHDALVDPDCRINVVAKYLDKELKVDLHMDFQKKNSKSIIKKKEQERKQNE
jgi:hypothetical protein